MGHGHEHEHGSALTGQRLVLSMVITLAPIEDGAPTSSLPEFGMFSEK
jgi:hypothetical protein